MYISASFLQRKKIMKHYIQLFISFLIIMLGSSYGNSTKSLLLGKWFYATGNVKEEFYKRFIEFDSNNSLNNQNGKLGSFKILNDSTIEMIGYRGDTLFSISVDEQMLILVDLDQDTTIFLKKEYVHPSEKGIEQKALISAWHLIYTWDDDADTLKFDKKTVTSNKAIRNNDKNKTASYRCINNRFIEFVYKNRVYIGEYHIYPEYMEMISPFSNGNKEGFIELTTSPKKFNKKLAKKLLGDWISERDEITFSDKGILFSKGDSVGTYTVLSDTLLYFGDKMKANFMWYEISNNILTITENSHNNDGDISFFLKENALLSTEELKRTYKGDWQIINSSVRKERDTTSFFLSIEDNEFHTYKGSERANSVSYKIANNRINVLNKHDTTYVSIIQKDDTLYLSNQIKLIKCKKSIKKEPHELVFKEPLEMLNLHKVIPHTLLSKWVEDIQKVKENRITFILNKDRYFINSDDSLALEKLITKSIDIEDSIKILIGKRENYRAGDQICPLYMIKSIPSVKGSLVGSVKISSLNQNAWLGQTISIKLNEAGRQQFESLTNECINKEIAIVINGVLNSAPTVLEPIPGGEFTISIPFDKDAHWQDGVERLKKWGLE